MKKKVFEWLKLNMGKSVWFVLLLSLLGMTASLVELLFVVASKNLVNAATYQTDTSIIEAALFLGILLILCLVINSVVSLVDMWLSAHLERKIKSGIFKRLLNKDYLSLNNYHTGDILNRIDSDVNVIVSGVVSIIPSFVIFFTLIVGGMILLYDIAPYLALFIIILSPLMAIFARIYSVKYKKIHKTVQRKDSKAKSFLLEAMQSILVVKAFDRQREISSKSYALYDDLYKTKMKRTYLSLIANAGLFIFFNAGYYLSFAYGVYLINTKVILFGELVAILQLVSNIQEPFKSVSSLIPQYFSMVASVERVLEIESLDDNIRDENTVSDFDAIVFDNVTFEYDDTDKIENISLSISKGSFVSLTGESGSGKTTLIKLLMGVIIPKSGRIYFETKNGDIDIKSAGMGMFSYVPQGNLLFSGTILDNVCFFDDSPDLKRAEDALKCADIWEYISSLEDGLNTYIGENGEGLSEGQSQRIAIARAVYNDSDIIVLDEATSSLDDKTERNILSNISMYKDKTIIAITHRKAALEISDVNINLQKNPSDI